MAPKPASKWPAALRWGIIGGLAAIALSMIWHVAGWTSYSNNLSPGNLASMFLGWIITLAAISMGIKQYRDESLGGFITFGNGFGAGILVALVMAVIGALFTAVFMSVIAPDIMAETMDQARQRLEDQGMDDEAIDQAMKISAMFTSAPVIAAFGFVFSMLGGLVFSLIGAAIMRKDPPTY